MNLTITITGPHSMGKSTLAARIAKLFADEAPDATVNINDPDASPKDLAERTHKKLYGYEGMRVDIVVATVGAKE